MASAPFHSIVRAPAEIAEASWIRRQGGVE
jgi:hypothetical protein